MANFVSAPTVTAVASRVAAGTVPLGVGSAVTYHYLTVSGQFGSTATRSGIPSGATVLRIAS